MPTRERIKHCDESCEYCAEPFDVGDLIVREWPDDCRPYCNVACLKHDIIKQAELAAT